MLNRSLFVVLLVLLPIFSNAQVKETPKTSPAPSDFSKEAFVIDEMQTSVIAEADGTFSRAQATAIHILADAGVKNFAVLSFPYTSDNQSVSFDYVRVRKSDGTVVATPDYNIQDMPADITRVAPMYSDIHEKHVAVKGLGVGDTLEYLVRYKEFKPQVPGQFWVDYTFEKNNIAKKEHLEISIPRQTRVTVSSPDLKPEVKEEGDRRVYRWASSNLERKEEKTPRRPKRLDDQPSVTVTTFSNWEEIGRWYNQLQQDQVKVTPAIQSKAAELTKGLTTDDEKLRAIYSFVALRIHYVGLSFGIGRYQPHPAEDVLGNEYGDCKDKHTLLASLLKAAGYDAWPALVNSSKKLNKDAPSPSQFDHVITAIPRGDKLIWLDTTPEVSPFGLILTNIRDKDVLLIPSSKPAYILKTPADPPFAGTVIFSVEGKLTSEGSFSGKMEQSSRGDSEVVLRSAFRQIPETKWKDLAQLISYRSGYGGDVSNVTASAIDDISQPFHVSYDYLRKKYGDWENRRMTPPLPPIGIESTDLDEKAPDEPLFLGAPGELTYKSKVELPKGSSLKPPKNVDLVQPYAEYHTMHSFENGVLLSTRRFVIKNREVPLDQWEGYVKFRKAISDDEGQFISIDGLSKAPGSEIASADDLAKTFDEGYLAMKNRDWGHAQEAFQKVLEKDPEYPFAHYNLAVVLKIRSRNAEALDHFRKEREISPKDEQTLQATANMLVSMNRPDEAVNEYRKFLKLDPTNAGAAFDMAKILWDQNKVSEVIVELENALKASPDSRSLRFTLAFSYLKAGQREKAVSEYRELIEGKYASKDTDAMTLNDVAYRLADSNLGIEFAKRCAEKAIAQLESRSAADSENDEKALPLAKEIAATWDTLGWIYLRLGDLPQAESYIRSAWLLSQRTTVGDHLGQVYERQGKKADAAHMYQLALAAESTRSSAPDASEVAARLEQHKQIIARYQKLTGRSSTVEIRRSANGQWSATPEEELGRMRKVRIDLPTAQAASGEISIVFSPQKIIAVRHVSGDDGLKKMFEKFETAKYKVSFPAESNAVIVRRAGVFCSRGAGCDVVLHSAD